jgi:hypothetical protein
MTSAKPPTRLSGVKIGEIFLKKGLRNLAGTRYACLVKDRKRRFTLWSVDCHEETMGTRIAAFCFEVVFPPSFSPRLNASKGSRGSGVDQ